MITPKTTSLLATRTWRTSTPALPAALFVAAAFMGYNDLAGGAPAYRLDPLFVRPEVTLTAYPYRVTDDLRGGLLWVANGSRLDGISRER